MIQALQASRLRSLEDEKQRILGMLDDLPTSLKQAVLPGDSSHSTTDGFLKHAKSMMRRLFGQDVTTYRQTFLNSADSSNAKGHAVMSKEVAILILARLLACCMPADIYLHHGMQVCADMVLQVQPFHQQTHLQAALCLNVVWTSSSARATRNNDCLSVCQGLRRAFQSSGLDLPENELTEIFSQIDIDGSNFISFAEFCDAAYRAAAADRNANATACNAGPLGGPSIPSLRQKFVEAADSADSFGIALMSQKVYVCVCVNSSARARAWRCNSKMVRRR